MSPEPGHDYALVTPFLPVTVRGGPFDTDAYVAGYAMGQLDARLAASDTDFTVLVDVRNRDQADLIAMRHSHRIQPQGVDGQWARIRLTKTHNHPAEETP